MSHVRSDPRRHGEEVIGRSLIDEVAFPSHWSGCRDRFETMSLDHRVRLPQAGQIHPGEVGRHQVIPHTVIRRRLLCPGLDLPNAVTPQSEHWACRVSYRRRPRTLWLPRLRAERSPTNLERCRRRCGVGLDRVHHELGELLDVPQAILGFDASEGTGKADRGGVLGVTGPPNAAHISYAPVAAHGNAIVLCRGGLTALMVGG